MKGDLVNRNRLVQVITLAVAIVALTALTVAAQGNQNFALSQQQNALALKQYEWKSRTTVKREGETKGDQLSQMRYDSQGKLQATTIGSMPEHGLPTRGLRGAIAQKKKKEFVQTLDDLRALAKSYGELPPDKMHRFMSSATMTPEQGLVRLEGHDVLQSGDSMTVWIDPLSRKQRRVEIKTFLDRKPVKIVSEFRNIPQGGPTYLARNELNYNHNSVLVVTENFDYTLVNNLVAGAVVSR